MGTIRTEVRDQHLKFHPQEEDLLRPFLDGFYVTWGRRRVAYNTDVSVYFLKPEPIITEGDDILDKQYTTGPGEVKGVNENRPG